MLKSLTLLADRIPDPSAYPFSVPAISSLRTHTFHARVTATDDEEDATLPLFPRP